MNPDQRWIADAFLDELDTLKVNELPPMHVVDRRLAHCEMVLTEIPGDDPEEIALRANAEAVRDLCREPRDLEVIQRYISTRRAHLELLRSLLPEKD
jgi:hypothetical protein